VSFIETERLLLRTWLPGDLPALAAIYGDPETMRYILSGTKTPEQTRAAMQAMNDANDRDGCSLWPVVVKESSELIGACGLMSTERSDTFELGFVFAPGARGRGYALEAARASIAYGFDALHAARIVALVDPPNARSIVLLRKLGMSFDRVVRMTRGGRGADVMRYVLDARADQSAMTA
jgi:ribosomal-protein-alanine N-acetyltransferase